MEGGEGEAGGEPALRDEEKKSWLSSDSGFFFELEKIFVSLFSFLSPFFFLYSKMQNEMIITAQEKAAAEEAETSTLAFDFDFDDFDDRSSPSSSLFFSPSFFFPSFDGIGSSASTRGLTGSSSPSGSKACSLPNAT